MILNFGLYSGQGLAPKAGRRTASLVTFTVGRKSLPVEKGGRKGRKN